MKDSKKSLTGKNHDSLEWVAKLLSDGLAKKVVVLFGAGVSVSAGLPDFRSEDGIYSIIASRAKEEEERELEDDKIKLSNQAKAAANANSADLVPSLPEFVTAPENADSSTSTREAPSSEEVSSSTGSPLSEVPQFPLPKGQKSAEGSDPSSSTTVHPPSCSSQSPSSNTSTPHQAAASLHSTNAHSHQLNRSQRLQLALRDFARTNTPETLFNIQYFRKDPRPFAAIARELLPGSYNPSISHFFPILLNKKGLLLRVYTQNIDNLELIAGIPPSRLVEAHGSFTSSYCISCLRPYSLKKYRDEILAGKVPTCEEKILVGMTRKIVEKCPSNLLKEGSEQHPNDSLKVGKQEDVKQESGKNQDLSDFEKNVAGESFQDTRRSSKTASTSTKVNKLPKEEEKEEEKEQQKQEGKEKEKEEEKKISPPLFDEILENKKSPDEAKPISDLIRLFRDFSFDNRSPKTEGNEVMVEGSSIDHTRIVYKPCGGFIKPGIVFFGENLPERYYQLSIGDLPQSDLLIVMGTSLKVMPFAGLITRCSSSCPRLLINKEAVGIAPPSRRQMRAEFFRRNKGRNEMKQDNFFDYIEDFDISPYDYLSGGFSFFNSDNTRDGCYFGECDYGVTTLCELLGWKEELESLRDEWMKKRESENSLDHLWSLLEHAGSSASREG